jgi:hypothetical protein
MSPEAIGAAVKNALAGLKDQLLISNTEATALSEVFALTESDLTAEELRARVDALTKPILTSQKSSPVASMICSIAADSVEHVAPLASGDKRNKHDPEPRITGIGRGALDVAGAIGGAYIGAALGAPGGPVGSLGGAFLVGIICAGICSFLLP